MSSVREIDIKNRAYYLFDDMININLDPNKIKIDEKLYKNILPYHIGYVVVKNFSYIKINCSNHLYLIIDKVNGTLKKVMEIIFDVSSY